MCLASAQVGFHTLRAAGTYVNFTTSGVAMRAFVPKGSGLLTELAGLKMNRLFSYSAYVDLLAHSPPVTRPATRCALRPSVHVKCHEPWRVPALEQGFPWRGKACCVTKVVQVCMHRVQDQAVTRAHGSGPPSVPQTLRSRPALPASRADAA